MGTDTPIRSGNEWIFPDGYRLPVVAGGAVETDPSEADPEGDPGEKPTGEDELGDAGRKALDQERRARREAEKARKALEEKLREFEDRDKSDSEKAAERLAAAEKRASENELRAMRAEVAMAKGLTAAQAKRLVGSTIEEIEADADEILEAFPVDSRTPPPSQRPTPDLRSGGDGTQEPEETDPRKIAEFIPRP